jgi:hypothetical protein
MNVRRTLCIAIIASLSVVAVVIGQEKQQTQDDVDRVAFPRIVDRLMDRSSDNEVRGRGKITITSCSHLRLGNKLLN